MGTLPGLEFIVVQQRYCDVVKGEKVLILQNLNSNILNKTTLGLYIYHTVSCYIFFTATETVTVNKLLLLWEQVL
jgi:hypothetical protein